MIMPTTPFQWSSPSRLHSLTPIPLEIYEEIFSYFRENDDTTAKELRRDLANLTLVCRFFSSLALPRIFEKMSFFGSSNVSDDRAAYTSRFCRALLNDQEPAKTLAQYVKTCEFGRWLTVDVDVTRSAFFSMYCSALAKMTWVESLELSAVLVDERLLKAMKKLGHLKSLNLIGCGFAPNLSPNDVKAIGQALCLRSFVITRPNAPDTSYYTFMSALSFTLLKSLVVDHWDTVQHLANYPSPLPLEKLTIYEVEDVKLLSILFRNLPELLHLHIFRVHVPHLDVLDSLRIPSGALPKLSVFSGPPALLSTFVPSRPLRDIRLLGTLVPSKNELLSLPPLDVSLWASLGKTKASIRDLIIPKHFYCLTPLASVLPEVSTLKITWCHANWERDIFFPPNAKAVETAIRDLCSLWPPNHSVHQVFFDLQTLADDDAAFLNLQSQYKTLKEYVVTAFPNVEQVNFIACVNWRRWLPDGAWRAEVPKSKRRYMFSIWDKMRDELVDYNGCFTVVLNPETLKL